MKYTEPIMQIFLLPNNEVVITSGEGFTPGQGSGGGETPFDF